jgi:hypothetical protein
MFSPSAANSLQQIPANIRYGSQSALGLCKDVWLLELWKFNGRQFSGDGGSSELIVTAVVRTAVCCWFGLWLFYIARQELRLISRYVYIHIYVYECERDTLLVAQWLRHCATNRRFVGSIPDGVVIFHWHNTSGRTMALGSTQPLTEMSTRDISWS